MVSSRTLIDEPPRESVRNRVPNTPISARTPAFGASAPAWSIAPFTVEAPIGLPMRWIPMIQTTLTLDVALILILFILISGLVGVRLIEVVSKSEIGRSLTSTSTTTDSGDADDPRPDTVPPHQGVVSADTPLEFLSDEGRIVRLLVENGGQIRQHRIVDETDWSKSKVSRILSKMHEAGNIEKVSLGRENVIRLTDGESAEDEQGEGADHPLP